jgi:D-alanyl-D-alanine carboxypeptidase (penicillin-binding protein 5/6)
MKALLLVCLVLAGCLPQAHEEALTGEAPGPSFGAEALVPVPPPAPPDTAATFEAAPASQTAPPPSEEVSFSPEAHESMDPVPLLSGDDLLSLRLSSRAEAVLELPCGAFLYGRNAHERLAPASLTKLVTALIAVEQPELDALAPVRVSSSWLAATTRSTVMGLEPGMQLSLRDLLYGLLPSGNDAALAIAERVAGSVPAFVELMNEKVAKLGLRNTRFANPHGLDAPDHYTTAFDIAVIGRAFLEHPELARIAATESYQPHWSRPPLKNSNQLLRLYPGALGVKIGYTRAAGQTVVAAAERDGRLLIVSVLGSMNRYADAIALLDWAFSNTQPSCPSE